jgi:hypothetical protein
MNFGIIVFIEIIIQNQQNYLCKKSISLIVFDYHLGFLSFWTSLTKTLLEQNKINNILN